MENILSQQVHQAVSAALERLGVHDFDVSATVEIPPNSELGDYAFPCFQLAKILRKSPALIAEEVARNIPERPWLARVDVVKAYVNFFLDPGETARSVLESITSPDFDETGDDEPQKNIVLDFSSPNIAKPFHVGHLRTTIIGHSLARIFERVGYRAVRLNYLGDWGTQFGKLIVAYRKWGDPARLKEKPIRELLDLYVKFHQEVEKDPSLEDEGRAAFLALEEGTAEERELWQTFRDLSLREFEKHYRRLGVTFDLYRGESAYNDKMEEAVDLLREKGLLSESEGALVVELDDLPPCLIKKKDGATLYATRDIAAAIDRYKTYEFEHLLYVVGAPQQLHFQQVFGVLCKAGFPWVDRLEHIPFGHIRIGDMQLSTRRGNVVFLEDLLDEAVNRAKEIIEERNPDLDNKEEVAESVGIGAIIFNDLAHNRIKDISFDWESALNFEGDTGPYVQYTHARAASLLRKSESTLTFRPEEIRPAELSDADSFRLTKQLAEYTAAVKRAADEREPSEIARYLLLLCHDFNTFYHGNRILGTDQEMARLRLVAAVKKVLADGLFLLGIAAPEAM